MQKDDVLDLRAAEAVVHSLPSSTPHGRKLRTPDASRTPSVALTLNIGSLIDAAHMSESGLKRARSQLENKLQATRTLSMQRSDALDQAGEQIHVSAKKKWSKARMFVRTGLKMRENLDDLRSILGQQQANRTIKAGSDGLFTTDASGAERPTRCIVHPNGSVVSWWDISQVILLLYVAVMVPLRLGFALKPNEPGSMNWWIELLSDLYFMGASPPRPERGVHLPPQPFQQPGTLD